MKKGRVTGKIILLFTPSPVGEGCGEVSKKIVNWLHD